jgi:hypothetical protein
MVMMKLITAVTFHYVEARLKYLSKALAHHPTLADAVETHVITNTSCPAELERIRDAMPAKTGSFSPNILVSGKLWHPYLLTWVHKDVFRAALNGNSGFTHFMYVEDDIEVKRANVDYWVDAREWLRPHGLIPSFFRVERSSRDQRWKSTDTVRPVDPRRQPRIELREDIHFINMPNPYQGMYLMDTELMREHLSSRPAHWKIGRWRVRERAAQGQTFVNVPAGFSARNVVPFNPKTRMVLPECLVHHLPNNYADDPFAKFGKVDIETQLFASGRPKPWWRLAGYA